MSEKSRKSFSSQAKAKVALEAVRGGKTVNEIAQEFGVHGMWSGSEGFREVLLLNRQDDSPKFSSLTWE